MQILSFFTAGASRPPYEKATKKDTLFGVLLVFYISEPFRKLPYRAYAYPLFSFRSMLPSQRSALL